MNYLTRFILNTAVLPLTLVLLVAATWATNTREHNRTEKVKGSDEKISIDDDNDDDDYDELQASKYSDYYFAVFLCCESSTCVCFGLTMLAFLSRVRLSPNADT